jgi:hypothetical protein
MQESYLEITFRHGRILAAYYYLPRRNGQLVARSQRREPGLVVDFDDAGSPIGIEITAPKHFSLDAFNTVLEQLGHEPVDQQEFAPLRAA